LVLIDRTTGTNIGNMTSNGALAAAFDGDANQANTASAGTLSGATTGYVGKTLTGPKVFGRAVVSGSNSHGYAFSATPTITLNIQGKNGAAPSGPTDGTLLGTISFTDTTDESAGRTINSTDLVNTWDHLFLEVDPGVFTNKYCAELVLYEWA